MDKLKKDSSYVACSAAVVELVRAARNLVDKMETIDNDPRYMNVWEIAQLHLGPYAGPQYKEEFDAVNAALAPFQHIKDAE